MQRFARLKADLAHRGRLIGDIDTLIAARALRELIPVIPVILFALLATGRGR
jgi:predicted nucleic acid-binding protein